MKEPQQPKQCQRCGVDVEFYISYKNVDGEWFLCNDCCRDFLEFLISEQRVAPYIWVLWANANRP